MAGIYIKDMVMPKTCLVCEFYGYLDNQHSYCKRKPSNGPVPIGRDRPSWCSLVEVPAHGRLIDADALRQSIGESIEECYKWADEVEGKEMYARVSQSLGTFVECSLRIKSAPTIIPAEEDNNG